MIRIRLIALGICLLTVLLSIVACNRGNSVTTTATTTITGGNVNTQPQPITVFKSYDETFADGFERIREGSVLVEDGKIVVNNNSGAYHVKDKDLALNSENYTELTISFDMTFDALPSSGGVGIVAPLFWINGEIKYQVFLRVGSDGVLGYHANGKWIQPILVDGEPVIVEMGKTYRVKIDYDIAYGSYAIFLDDVQIEDDVLEFIMDEDVTRFAIRFLDNNANNGPCTVALSNVEIVAEP